MSRELTKAVKGSTSAVKTLADALDRARAIYLAGLNRLQAEYFERVREATRDLQDVEEAEAEAAATTPAAEPQAAETPPATEAQH
jgi:hypothetical protein